MLQQVESSKKWTPEQFCLWLQGYVEISGKLPDVAQWEVIKEHLGLVFDKVTTKKAEPEVFTTEQTKSISDYIKELDKSVAKPDAWKLPSVPYDWTKYPYAPMSDFTVTCSTGKNEILIC